MPETTQPNSSSPLNALFEVVSEERAKPQLAYEDVNLVSPELAILEEITPVDKVTFTPTPIFQKLLIAHSNPTQERVRDFQEYIKNLSEEEINQPCIVKNKDETLYEGNEKTTPLMLACYLGMYDYVKLLLDKGAKPNQQQVNMERTPLHCTIMSKSPNKTALAAIVQLLIARGAKPQITETCGSNALHFCIEHDQLSLIRTLKNAMPSQAFNQLMTLTKSGRNIAQKAYFHKRSQYFVNVMCLYLESALNPSINQYYFSDPIHSPVLTKLEGDFLKPENCQFYITKPMSVLLDNQRLVDAYTGRQLTSQFQLHNIQLSQTLNTLAALELPAILAQNQNNNNTAQLKNENITLLMLACYYGNLEAVEMLLAKGVDPNQQTTSQKTALHMLPISPYLTGTKAKNIATLMFQYGANFKLRDIHGNTFIHQFHIEKKNEYATEILGYVPTNLKTELLQMRNNAQKNCSDITKNNYSSQKRTHEFSNMNTQSVVTNSNANSNVQPAEEDSVKRAKTDTLTIEQILKNTDIALLRAERSLENTNNSARQSTTNEIVDLTETQTLQK